MQLKLNLFEDSLDNYRRGSKLNQKALQTGHPRGTFKYRDPHPWAENVFYRRWKSDSNIETWTDSEAIKREQYLKTKYYQTNKEHLALKSREWLKKNKEWVATRHKEYIKNNRDIKAAKDARRRARKKKASVYLNKREEQIIKQIYSYRIRLENKLGIKFHVDHIIPLSKGGLHHPLNLQVVPAVWNMRKKNTHTERWLPNGM